MTIPAREYSFWIRAALLAGASLCCLDIPAAMARVAVTSATAGDPLGKPPAEVERILRIGIDVQADELITTGGNDRAHLVFLDGTSLTVGPNAQVKVDKFVYDPNTKIGDLAISASKGVLRLVGGKISKTNPIVITTPSATISIRGGIGIIDARADRTEFTLVFGHGRVSGQGVDQKVDRPGYSVTTVQGNKPSTPTPAVQANLSNQMGQLEGRSGGQGSATGSGTAGTSSSTSGTTGAPGGGTSATSGGTSGSGSSGSTASGASTTGTATGQSGSPSGGGGGNTLNAASAGTIDQGVQSFSQQNSAQGPSGVPGLGTGGQVAAGGSGSGSGSGNGSTSSNIALFTATSNVASNAVSTTNPATNPNSATTTTQVTTSTSVAQVPSTTQVVVSYGSLGRYLANPTYTNFNSSNLSVTPNTSNNAALAPTASQTTTNNVSTTTTTTTTNTTTLVNGVAANTQTSTSSSSTSSITSSTSTVTLTVPGVGSITLPWQLNTLQNGFAIASFTDPVFGTLAGSGYISATGDYFAYVFNTPSGTNQVGFFGGTPTASVPIAGFGVYSVRNASGGTIPFAPSSISGNSTISSSAVVSALYSVYSSNISPTVGQPVPGDAKATSLQATVSIAGQGSAQQSYMGAFIGDYSLDANSNTTFSSGSFNGTYRLGGSQPIGRLVSAASTPSTGSGNAIYGSTANVMVFTPDKLQTTVNSSGGLVTGVSTTRTPQASFNQPYNNLPGQDYFSVNVATQNSYSQTTSTTRTDQTLSGFVGGLVDQLTAGGGTSTRAATTVSPTDFSLTTSAANNRAAATINIQQWGTGNTSATFQLGGTSGSNYATSSFVNDGVYGLRDRPAGLLNNTTSVTSGGTTSTGADVNSSTVLVSAGTVQGAANSLFTASGVTPCTCAFLTWGWWGGDIGYSNNSVYNPGGRDRINLATYVAGTLTPSVQLPQTGSATYLGSAIGNVQNGGNSYLAVGTYANSWNFATQTGNVAIANFDGSSYGGTTALVRGTVQFNGSLNNGAGRTGALNGAFFSGGASNPVAGQAGSFSITGTSYKAAGTFAGQRQ